MKKSFVSIMVAALLLFAPAMYASDLNYGYQTPLYETSTFTADTADPGDPSPALKPDNGSVDFGAGGFGRMSSFTYLDTVPEYAETVMACGSNLVMKPLPRIPIAV